MERLTTCERRTARTRMMARAAHPRRFKNLYLKAKARIFCVPCSLDRGGAIACEGRKTRKRGSKTERERLATCERRTARTRMMARASDPPWV